MEMWPVIVDVRRSISPWQALMEFLNMETHAFFLTNTSVYKNITAYTSYECRQSHTSGSNQSHIFPKYKGLTWIILRRGGRHGCVQQNPVQTRMGQTPEERVLGPGQVRSNSSHQSTRGQISQSRSRRRSWCGESIQSPSPIAIILKRKI